MSRRFFAFGDIDALDFVELPYPLVLNPDFALFRVEASSINPSDVKNVGGAIGQTTLPRVPGRDYADVVEHGPPNGSGWR